MQYEILVADISEERSSFIKRLEYNEDTKVLTVFFRKYYADNLSYENVERKYFDEFLTHYSMGRFYTDVLKPCFKQIKTNTMASDSKRPPTKNQASDEKRYIKMSINVREILKQWLVDGEKGTYLNMTLQMLPDGKLDRYGNLGMIVQDVPQEIYQKEKTKPKEEKTLGPILGNACEFDSFEKTEGLPGQWGKTIVTDENGKEVVDDLPF
jgi:hypothetical protein